MHLRLAGDHVGPDGARLADAVCEVREDTLMRELVGASAQLRGRNATRVELRPRLDARVLQRGGDVRVRVRVRPVEHDLLRRAAAREELVKVRAAFAERERARLVRLDGHASDLRADREREARRLRGDRPAARAAQPRGSGGVLCTAARRRGGHDQQEHEQPAHGRH